MDSEAEITNPPVTGQEDRIICDSWNNNLLCSKNTLYTEYSEELLIGCCYSHTISLRITPDAVLHASYMKNST